MERINVKRERSRGWPGRWSEVRTRLELEPMYVWMKCTRNKTVRASGCICECAQCAVSRKQ